MRRRCWRTTDDDGRQPIAIGHLSDSGDLKISFGFIFYENLGITTYSSKSFIKMYFKDSQSKNLHESTPENIYSDSNLWCMNFITFDSSQLSGRQLPVTKVNDWPFLFVCSWCHLDVQNNKDPGHGSEESPSHSPRFWPSTFGVIVLHLTDQRCK